MLMVPATPMQSPSPVLLHMSQNDKSKGHEEGSSEAHEESDIKGHGTSSIDNAESGKEDDSEDFCGDASDKRDYAIKEVSVQLRVMQFLPNRIEICLNQQNVEIFLLSEAGL